MFSVLDEATSQISIALERSLYKKCLKMGITLISIGHRDSLKKFHQINLHINGDDASWNVTNDVHL